MGSPWLGLLFIIGITLLLLASITAARHTSRRRATYAPLTEDRLRLPGHTLRKVLEDKKEQTETTFLAFAFAAPAPMYFFLAKTSVATLFTISVFSFAVCIWVAIRLYKVFPEYQKLKLGLECEEYVGQELNLLMHSGAYVYHDIPCRNGNIDHVVIGHGQALAVETKGRRKPRKGTSGNAREYEVSIKGNSLIFPNGTDTNAVPQAKTNADILSKAIKKHCGLDFKVIPVIAVPGWKISSFEKYKDGNVVLVSPKRSNVLQKWLGRDQNRENTQLVADYIDSIARSVTQSTELIDANASDRFDFWSNRKPPTEKRIE